MYTLILLLTWKIVCGVEMDALFAGFVLIFGLLCPVFAENKYGDHGMVFTARPYKDRTDYRQLITIPTTPKEVATYPGRPQTFPGIQFDDIKKKLVACDVDYDMNRIYIYDYNYRSIILGTNFNTSMNKDQINFTTAYYGISQEYVKIAVDWISHNIYWTDPVMGAIVMTSGEPGTNHTMYKVLFNKHLDLPRGIAVDPLAGYLFWTDYSRQSKIERSSLVGQGRTLLVGTNLIYPEAITADHVGQRLYFVNSNAVESVDYDGKGRREIFSQSDAYFYDVAFHGGALIALDIESPRYAYFYDVEAKAQIEKITSSEEAYFGVCMYHKDNQPSKAAYRCPNAGCEDICVDEPGKPEATCLCRTGYELNSDGKTCKMLGGQYQRAIVLNNGTHLCLLDIRILSDHQQHKVDCFYEHTVDGETMTYMEINGRTREVYIATQNAIYRVPIDQKNAQAVELTKTLPNNKGNGEITGMSWDYKSGHLYWSEMNPDAIFVMNPDSPATEFVQLASENHNLSDPRAILVLPHERQLIWLNGNASSYDVILMKTDLGATAPVETVTPTHLPTDVWILEPTHMLNHVKDRKLYIMDQGWSEILVFSYDGEYEDDYDFVDGLDFVIYNDYLLVAHLDPNNNTGMFSADLGFGSPVQKVMEAGTIEDIGKVVSMRILDVDVLEPPYTDPCKELNGKYGGCDQVCIAISNETTCICDVGFKLNADGKKCDSAYPGLKDRFALAVDSTNSKIHQISLDIADALNGIGTAGQTDITSVLYNYLHNKIIHSSKNEDQLWQVNLDGTNETMLAEISWGSPIRMALDPSTGNIYLTAESHWSWWLDNWSFLGVVSPTGAYKKLLEGDSLNRFTVNIPGDIVLHAEKGYMFWTDASTSEFPGKIARASMDGSNPVVIATGTGIDEPTSLAIDYEENMLYWSDNFLNNIYKSDLDGNKRETFLEVGSKIGDIRIVGNYLYYTTETYKKIRAVHKHNTSDVKEFGPDSGVGVLDALDVYIAAEVSKIPKHALCSVDNGGCSDFCLPNEAGGRTCGCELSVELLVDEKTCETSGCPAYTGNANIAADCLRLPGYQCEFECFSELKPKDGINKLTCLANKTWDIDLPCRERFHQNKYNDEAVVLTARGFSLNDFNQVVVIPAKPEDIPTYPARSFPGFRFPDTKKKLHAVDVDYHTNMVYMYDYEYRTIVVGSNFSADANIDAINFTTEHYGIAKEYVKIAVDWVSHNIYWTDSIMGSIIMAPGKQYISPTLYKVVIQDHLDVPRGIAIDPLAGYIFWTDVGRHEKIERASLLGEDRRDIVSNNLYIPDAIAADHATQRIYFTNYNYIETIDYDGHEWSRTSLAKNSQAYFFDISVFNNIVMATETSNYYLYLYDATTGEKISQEGSAQEGYFGICGYSLDAQPTSPNELCVSAGCQDICVEEPNSVTATCLCRTGFELQSDGKTCKEAAGQYHRAILLNNGTHLCLLDIRVLSDHHDHTIDCFYQHTATNDTITYIDVNMKSREVYFTAGKTIYRVNIDFSSDAQDPVPLTMTTHGKATEFTGLSYDWINDHLYWSQAGPDGIFLLNPDNPEDFLQIATEDSTSNPRAVLVAPHNKTVFWIATNKTTGNTSYIEYGDLGLTRPLQMIVPSESDTFVEPTHLLHDNKNDRILALDVGWQQLLEVKYNGTLTNYFDVGDAKDFGLYNDYIMVIEHDNNGNTRLYSGDIAYFPYSLTADGLVKDISTVVSMKVIDVDVLQKTYASPCGEKEGLYGGCEQVCIPVDNKPSCRCDTGFTLNADNKTCNSFPVKDNFTIVVDNLHSKIYQIPLDNDTQIQGIKVPNKDDPTGIIYNYLTNQVVFGSWESSQIWGVNIDGTNATFIADIDQYAGTPTNFALDPSTGNLFITAYSYYVDYGLKDSFIAAVNPTGGVAILYNMGEYMADIVLHPKKGLMFWTDYGDPAMVARAAMDGTNMIAIAEGIGDVVYPTGLAIDYKEDHLYWLDALLHKVYRSDLDGNNKMVFHEDEGYLNDIRLYGDYLYYTALDNLHLTRLNKDATGLKRIGPTSGIGSFATIDVYRSSMVSTVPVNDVCSKDNGNCSHFCLPNGNGGRTCGCEGMYKLLSDGITCENVPRCPAEIVGGIVDQMCHRLVGQQCDFKCNRGYKKKEGVLKLLCQDAVDPEMAESQPNWDDETACEEIFCPAIIPNGELPADCGVPKVDKSCLAYTCNQGYEKNPAITSFNCTVDGVWDSDITTLCKEKCPVLTVERDMAVLTTPCNRDPQDNCGYTCKQHWKPASNRTTIKCTSPSRWNVNTATLCEEIKCPDYVPNGIVHNNCSYTVGSVCTFDCNDRHNRNGDISKISCLPSGKWDKIHDKIPLCIAIPVQPEAQTDSVAIGLGVGLGILVILIILIFVCILLQRKGKLHLPIRKSGGSGSAFENPQYLESSFDEAPSGASGQANKDFTYATLKEDKLELEQPSRSPENVYDNSAPATLPASAINPKF